MSVKSQTPDPDELHSLLNHAFEGWGSKSYFDWKYTQYPDYIPNEDNILIKCNGQIVAARRIFRRKLVLPTGETVSAHIHGGTVVHEKYRGNGYYSELLDLSMQISEDQNSRIFTFNRSGKITTKHHQKEGWNQVILPIQVKILSPTAIINDQYLNSSMFDRMTNPISPVERRIMQQPTISRVIAKCASPLFEDCESEDPREDQFDEEDGVELIEASSVSSQLLSKLAEHLSNENGEKYHFDRSAMTIEHCLMYPGTRLFLARRSDDKEILGLVIAGILDKGEVTECRVLEHTWTAPKITQHLYDQVEEYGHQNSADVIVTCSKYRPGPGWIPIDTEYMMWPGQHGDLLPDSYEKWRITIYDVL